MPTYDGKPSIVTIAADIIPLYYSIQACRQNAVEGSNSPSQGPHSRRITLAGGVNSLSRALLRQRPRN